MTRSDILDMVDDGALDAKEALNAALQYLSTDDVDDLAVTNGWDDFIDNGWDDEEESEDDEVYFDPTDGYKDTDGFHNSVDEAEDEALDAEIEAKTNAPSQPTDEDWEDYYDNEEDDDEEAAYFPMSDDGTIIND